jgi:tetratricopeptide (TPR) repeat protein
MAKASRRRDIVVSNLLDRGLVRFAIGKRDEAISLWQQALERAPGDARALDYLQSVGALPLGALDEAAATTGESAPVTGDQEPVTLERPPTDSLVPPFTQEVASYVTDDEADEIDVEPVVPDVEILVRNSKDEEAAGDLEAAFKYAEEALKREPDHAEANQLGQSLRKRLADLYRKELEPLERVPYLRATDASILELSLDPIGGFLISQIDGEITVEELLTILGTFDEFRVLSSLHFFLENGIIELR